MTITLPDKLADQFARRVPARERTRFIAEALSEKLIRRKRLLIRACEIANRNSEVVSLERDLGILQDEMPEPWIDAPAQ